MCIWIDCDSCPVSVRQHISTLAVQSSIKAIFVANHFISIDNINTPFVSFMLCEKGKDEADNLIFSSVSESDIVVTRDILFAQRLVKSGYSVINDRGTRFDEKNIEKFVSERNLSLMMSNLGLKKGYSKNSYSKKEFSAFCECLDREIAKKKATLATYK